MNITQGEEVRVVRIDVKAHGPMLNDSLNYDYEVLAQNEVLYLLNCVKSFELVDDGKTIRVNDASVYEVRFYKDDGSFYKFEYEFGRIFDNDGKEYGLKGSFGRFLTAINALKTQKLTITDDDVNTQPSKWAESEINIGIDKELVPKWNQIGYVSKINRLEVCQLINNFLTHKGIEIAKAEDYSFEDTYDIAVKNSYLLGLIDGKSETEFAPYDYITREEFAKILSRTYSYLNNDSIESRDLNYIDRDRISEYAVDDVKKVTQLGLMHGNENGEFEPQNNITKEEVIVTLLRLSEIASVDGIIAQ